MIAELRQPKGMRSGAPYLYRKERETINGFSHGYHSWQYCLWVCTHNGSRVPKVKATAYSS